MRHDEYIKEKKTHVYPHFRSQIANHSFRFHMLTWNMNASEVTPELCDTLLDVEPRPDVYIIGYLPILLL